MKRRFIINPASGKGLSQSSFEELERYFRDHIHEFDYVITQNQEDIVRQTQIALRENVDQVVAVGGDGTLNAVVNGFFDKGEPIPTHAALAVAKWGTGSDYFRTLTHELPHQDWREVVLHHEAREVDVGRIRFANPQFGERIFANIASVGITASIVLKKTRAPRWLPGQLSYFFPTLKTLPSYRPQEVQIKVDQRDFSVPLIGLFVAKGLFAGGGMKFGAHADLKDGLFDVTIIPKMPITDIVRNLPKLYSGEMQGVGNICKLKGREVQVSCKDPLPVEFDGEVYGTTNITVTLIPKAIRVCFPK